MPKIEIRKPAANNLLLLPLPLLQPTAEKRTPKAESGKPENQKPKAGNRKPKTKS